MCLYKCNPILNRMKKTMKLTAACIFWLAIPMVSSLAIMLLWNGILIDTCGFAAIDYITALGLFLLTQFLSGAFIVGLGLLGGIFHLQVHHHGHLHNHWHEMSDQEKLDFIERRRSWFMGYP